jgi:hypothetical protein
MTTTTMTDDWRRQIEREALDQGIPPDIARLIAEQCSTPETATADLSNAREIFRACRLVNGAELAGVALKARLPEWQVVDTLRAALRLPSRDCTRLSVAGRAQARTAFALAGIARAAYGAQR